MVCVLTVGVLMLDVCCFFLLFVMCWFACLFVWLLFTCCYYVGCLFGLWCTVNRLFSLFIV